MKGWFDQQFELQGLGMWDAYPQGRFGHIIMSAARRERLMLTNYLTVAVPGAAHTRTRTHMPVILMARFVNNVYLGLTGIDRQAQELPAGFSMAQSASPRAQNGLKTLV